MVHVAPRKRGPGPPLKPWALDSRFRGNDEQPIDIMRLISGQTLMFRSRQTIHCSSWPDLIRPSTNGGSEGAVSVDARHKAGHDELCSFPIVRMTLSPKI